MIRVAWKFAVFCGVFLVLIFHVAYYFGIHPFISLSTLAFDLIIFGLFVFFGIQEYRNEQANKVLHFWQGMTVGFNVYVMATVIFMVYLIIYFQLDPEFVELYKLESKALLAREKLVFLEKVGEETYYKELAGLDEATQSDLVLSGGLKKILAGFFVTPMLSLILRKQH